MCSELTMSRARCVSAMATTALQVADEGLAEHVPRQKASSLCFCSSCDVALPDAAAL